MPNFFYTPRTGTVDQGGFQKGWNMVMNLYGRKQIAERTEQQQKQFQQQFGLQQKQFEQASKVRDLQERELKTKVQKAERWDKAIEESRSAGTLTPQRMMQLYWEHNPEAAAKFQQDIAKEEVKAGLKARTSALKKREENVTIYNPALKIERKVPRWKADLALGADVGWTQDKPKDWSKSGVTVNMPKPVPAGQTEKLIGYYEFSNQLKRITTNWEPMFSGPIEGRLGAIRDTLGINLGLTEEKAIKEAVFRQVTKDISDTLLRLRSGAQINEQEYQRLLKLVPHPNLPDRTFLARLNSLDKTINNNIKTRESVLKKMGYMTPEQPTIQTDLSGMTDEQLLEALE